MSLGTQKNFCWNSGGSLVLRGNWAKKKRRDFSAFLARGHLSTDNKCWLFKVCLKVENDVLSPEFSKSVPERNEPLDWFQNFRNLKQNEPQKTERGIDRVLNFRPTFGRAERGTDRRSGSDFGAKRVPCFWNEWNGATLLDRKVERNVIPVKNFEEKSSIFS